jgi:hypothetical protein
LPARPERKQLRKRAPEPLIEAKGGQEKRRPAKVEEMNGGVGQTLSPPNIAQQSVTLSHLTNGQSKGCNLWSAGGVSTLASQIKREAEPVSEGGATRLSARAQHLVQEMLKRIEEVLEATQRSPEAVFGQQGMTTERVQTGEDGDDLNRLNRLPLERQTCFKKLYESILLKTTSKQRAKELARAVEGKLYQYQPELGEQYLHCVKSLANEFLKKGVQEQDIAKVSRASMDDLELILMSIKGKNPLAP